MTQTNQENNNILKNIFITGLLIALISPIILFLIPTPSPKVTPVQEPVVVWEEVEVLESKRSGLTEKTYKIRVFFTDGSSKDSVVIRKGFKIGVVTNYDYIFDDSLGFSRSYIHRVIRKYENEKQLDKELQEFE